MLEPLIIFMSGFVLGFCTDWWWTRRSILHPNRRGKTQRIYRQIHNLTVSYKILQDNVQAGLEAPPENKSEDFLEGVQYVLQYQRQIYLAQLRDLSAQLATLEQAPNQLIRDVLDSLENDAGI